MFELQETTNKLARFSPFVGKENETEAKGKTTFPSDINLWENAQTS